MLGNKDMQTHKLRGGECFLLLLCRAKVGSCDRNVFRTESSMGSNWGHMSGGALPGFG